LLVSPRRAAAKLAAAVRLKDDRRPPVFGNASPGQKKLDENRKDEFGQKRSFVAEEKNGSTKKKDAA
jgi:hypothetical protein